MGGILSDVDSVCVVLALFLVILDVAESAKSSASLKIPRIKV